MRRAAGTPPSRHECMAAIDDRRASRAGDGDRQVRKVGLSQKAVGTLTPRLRQLLGRVRRTSRRRTRRTIAERTISARAVLHTGCCGRQSGVGRPSQVRSETGRRRRRHQVALAWLLAQKPWIGPTMTPRSSVGSRRASARLGVELTAPDLAEIECAAGAIAVGGERYPPALLATTGPANVRPVSSCPPRICRCACRRRSRRRSSALHSGPEFQPVRPR